ncbi:hypothetical protein [Kaistella polysaccharea]|uniref:hypothetical protein n=1 Tax=Kaistella polysaccharea TaxID=2878534 RepID=UPI001CF11B67|nr:hypothetical protein [Kaistella polysaccharea]
MKQLTLLFLVISTFTFAQMPNISSVWMNNSQPYTGTIGAEKTPLKLKINISEQDKLKDQEYYLAGFSIVENNSSKFEGKLKIINYKAGKKRNSVFGEYEFAEENKGKHSGIFAGKFVYTFMWNKKTEKIERQFIEFFGTWKSYDGTLNFPTRWSNQVSN